MRTTDVASFLTIEEQGGEGEGDKNRLSFEMKAFSAATICNF